VDIRVSDFNAADEIFEGELRDHWQQVHAALTTLSLHLKESDQANIVGSLIFDPVGTNAGIKVALQATGWAPNVPIPEQFAFLGTDVDFVKDSALVEVQFSNYPFLLNNTVRAELIYKSQTVLHRSRMKALIMITKAHMFPASNSTLYYEQAHRQLSELSRHDVLDIPIRLVGLFAARGPGEAVFTSYATRRYARQFTEQAVRPILISPGPSSASRCRITFA